MKRSIHCGNAIFYCIVGAIMSFLFFPVYSMANGISSVNLLDASANVSLQPVSNGDTIELYGYDAISFEAVTYGSVTKVEFYWNGSFERSESSAPYCLAGDQAGDFNPWHFFNLNVIESIKVIAFNGATKVDTVEINFVLMNTGPPRVPSAPLTFSCLNNFDVLVYNEESTHTHNSVDDATLLIQNLGLANGFTVTVDSTGAEFDNLATLNNYEVVVFANTNGSSILDATQKQNFEYYIQQDGGFVGIHSAANTYRYGTWPWYNELVGAIPGTQPKYTSQSVSATISPVVEHAINADFPSSKNINEKYYYWNTANGYFSPNNNVLLEVSSTGSQSYDAARPVAWYKEYDGGRSYYMSLGHKTSLFSPGDTDYKQHLLNGIKWAADKKLTICGEFKKWHTLDLTFTGPYAYENGSFNTFLDYRLNVTFTNGSEVFTVPGYYAADGYACETESYRGDKWRVHFVPNKIGLWNYSVSFVAGTDVAINSSNGTPVSYIDGLTGSFTITQSDKNGNDFRAKGRLKHVGEHYLQFEETEDYFVKGGTNSPENFLGYFEFDGTYDNDGQANDLESSGYGDGLHHYDNHVQHWNSGDPVWQQNKGKGIIGAINYLASFEINSIYMVINNVEGDGREVFPWTTYQERVHYDVSKLDQWNLVFKHMGQKGIMSHLVLQEAENDQLLDNGALGTQRKLYYREMIARFSHHLGINWNMGEENTNTDQQRKDFATYFKNADPYQNLVSVHTAPGDHIAVYTPLLGYPDVDGASIQTNVAGVHYATNLWKDNSANAGLKWIVQMDEIGPPEDGAIPDGPGNNLTLLREEVLWGNLMAGGAGVEWYFGYNHPNNDLDCEDFTTRQNLWRYTKKALKFFNDYIPFIEMDDHNNLTSVVNDDYCFAKPGEVYAIYLPSNMLTTDLNLQSYANTFDVQWYDPRNGGALVNGSVTSIQGPGLVNSIGSPPGGAVNKDWVALVTLQTGGQMSANTNVSHPTCYQNSNGSIQVNIGGGVPPYSYVWSNSATTSDISNVMSGVYTVTVTDANSNVNTITEILIDPNPVQFQSNVSPIPCAGMGNGSATIVVSGGVSPYSYSWSTSPGLNSNQYLNMSAGIHQVTVTDMNGCSKQESIWINEPSPLISMYIPAHPSCFGAIDGNINLLVSGGIAPYSYVWCNGFTTEDVNGLGAGLYFVQVTDAKGCASLATILLNDPLPISYSAVVTNVSGMGLNDGSIVLAISNAVNPTLVNWISQPGNFSNAAYNLTSGYHSFTITDANACTLSGGETVNQPQSIIKLPNGAAHSGHFILNPNASNSESVQIQLLNPPVEESIIIVLNSIGKIVYSSKMDVEENVHAIPFNELQLNAGVYFVRLKNSMWSETVKCLLY
ncbi:MAG: DUF5060 domain-containing protein [Bacteroidia bacterium]|nr:DUF5060 domain-containing protein [Bacteroidia bacterium]